MVNKYSTKRQKNGCYCIEQHSSQRDIVRAFARCKHPKNQRMRLDAEGVARPTGLEMCCHCGAHRRTHDGKWVYPHLASCALTAGRRTQA